MCPVTFPCTCSSCSSSSIRPVLPKIEVRLTEIIPTLVARLLNSNMTSSDPNPNFQYLRDLCLTQYNFSGDHSSLWVWCHPHRVLPLARGLTFTHKFCLGRHYRFHLKSQSMWFWTQFTRLSQPNEILKFRHIPKFNSYHFIPQGRSTKWRVCMVSANACRAFSISPLAVGDTNGQWSLSASAMGRCPETSKCSHLRQDVQMQRRELAPRELDTHPWLHPTPAAACLNKKKERGW